MFEMQSYEIDQNFFFFFLRKKTSTLLRRISHDRQEIHNPGVEEHSQSTPKNL